MQRVVMVKLRSLNQMFKLVNEGKLGIIALDFNHYGGGPIRKEDMNKQAVADHEDIAEVIMDKQPQESVVRKKIERKKKSWKPGGWTVR